MLGCQSENGQKPSNRIPKDKMVSILADIHTIEALIETKVVYPDTALMIFNQEQQEIFEKYDVTQQQFKDSYNYYLKNLAEMDALYETVVDTLSMRETKAQIKSGSNPEQAQQ
ncbi:hypothetical protein PKOR_17670 [Pontibacter korlensis]|uniref:DUF4296 domain-containing protein n=1 Tax=Pontibacter korlensis TaxID=400092 RepID=A0A0E3UZ82_9BACT|nr:hypothetical protein PKOR_17670 [Pontibacter korlensis]